MIKNTRLPQSSLKISLRSAMSFCHNVINQRSLIVAILFIFLVLYILLDVPRVQYGSRLLSNISVYRVYSLIDSYSERTCHRLSPILSISNEPKLLISNDFLLRYFAEHKNIDGWVTEGTFYAVWLFIQFQYKQLQKLDAAIGEIGVHRGKLTAYMYLLRHRSKQQKLFAVDVFSKKKLNIDASGDGDRQKFLENIKRYANVSANEILLYEGSSVDLNAALTMDKQGAHWWRENLGEKRCQLVSIDGGHSSIITYSDLCLISNSLVDGGIVMVDDIDNPEWLGVRDGVSQFFAETSIPFTGETDPELLYTLNRRLTTPNYNVSCRIADATRKATYYSNKCSRLIPILQYANKLYLTTPNYYPHYVNFLEKLNDKGTNFIRYDTLRSTAGNVPIWSDSDKKYHNIFNEKVLPHWLAQLEQATK